MCTYRLKWMLFLLLGLMVWGHIRCKEIESSRETFISTCFGQSKADEPKNQGETDIQWFRDEMKISPKYMEREEGVLGMSWTHFFIMVFLVLFFVGAIVALIIRHKRTKELLALLLKDSTLER